MKNENSMQGNVIWRSIQQRVELDIINDKYKTADRVPSIAEMAELYDIGQSTSKKVLESMYREGTLTKRQGIGYFLKPLVKENLRKKHVESLNYRINKDIQMAKELNLTQEELQNIISDNIEKFY